MADLVSSAREKAAQLYTLGEEIFHSVSHGLGAVLSVAGLTLLVSLAVWFGDAYQVVGFSIYGGTLVLAYLASTLYHSFQNPRVKQVFKVFDHAAIYLLIAGTYTPFLLVAMRGVWGWTLLGLVWGLALLGVVFKVLFINRFQKVSVVGYVLLGWLSVVMLRELTLSLPSGGLWWLVAGGVAYTVGVIFYAMKRVRYMHAVWHLFVLAGSVCHYFAVLLYLAPHAAL
ncbi:MAG: hemolysin III family protein [Anaerolineales bacterium]